MSSPANKRLAIAIHGGAGPRLKSAITSDDYKAALTHAIGQGWNVLEAQGCAIDAVELAVIALENAIEFNAGRGSVLNADGLHELDASIMEGKTLNAGAVCSIKGVRNPISLARDVMEKSEHVLLAAQGAQEFARNLGYEFEKNDYFCTPTRHQQWLEAKQNIDKKQDSFGTVGAVACDANGNLAAATSTGGIVNKQYGRVGDSPLIGLGNYANNQTCAVSCTGSGEYFIRGVVAYDVACLIEHKKMSLKAAAREVIHKRILKLGGDGGLIAVDAQGNIAMPYNTRRMFRACQTSESSASVFL